MLPLPSFLAIFFETAFICFESLFGSIKGLLDPLNSASDGISDLF